MLTNDTLATVCEESMLSCSQRIFCELNTQLTYYFELTLNAVSLTNVCDLKNVYHIWQQFDEQYQKSQWRCDMFNATKVDMLKKIQAYFRRF